MPTFSSFVDPGPTRFEQFANFMFKRTRYGLQYTKKGAVITGMVGLGLGLIAIMEAEGAESEEGGFFSAEPWEKKFNDWTGGD